MSICSRKDNVSKKTAVFVMISKKDFMTGGYAFNFKMVEYLRSRNVDIDVLHYTTVPRGFPDKWVRANLYIYRKIRSSRPEVVIIGKSYQYVMLMRLLKPFHRFSVVYLMHHLEWEDIRSGIKAFLYRKVIRWLLGMSALVWTNSENTRSEIKKLGIPGEIIRTINPGFNKPEMDPPDRSNRTGPVRILCVGNIIPRKAQHIVIQACNKLEKGSFFLDLAGSMEVDKKYAEEISSLIRKNNLEDFVRLHKELGQDELEQVYRGADLFVHPVLWEAFGISVAEAMWSGLPVIASDVAAIPELVHHEKNGILVPPGNADKLAAAMNRLIRNKELRLKMGQKSRKLSEKLNDWNTTGEKFYKLVEYTAGWRFPNNTANRNSTGNQEKKNAH